MSKQLKYMGIDVSEHQGSIDFNLISKNDVNFVIIRCGYGYENSKDKKYITNFKGFRNLGIPIGIYWYSYSTSTEESVKEGQQCLLALNDLASELGENEVTLELPIYYDMEESNHINSEGDTIAELFNSFKEQFSNTSYSIGLYSSQSHIDKWYQSDKFKTIADSCSLWVANWTSSIEDTSSYQGYNYDIHQASEDGTITGINGKVDIDYSNLDFMQQLFNYFCHPLGLNGNTAKVTSYVSHGGAVDVSYSNGNDAVGSPVYSMTDGIITAAKYGCESIAKTSEEKGQNGGLGNHVIVKCTNTKYNELIDDNFYIVYAHLINPEDTTYSLSKTWKEGDSISKGSIIGGIGASGNTEGVDGYFVHVHIHFRTNSSDPSSTIKLVQNGNYSIPNWDSLKNKTIASSSSSSSGLPVIENNSLNYCYGIFSGTPELFTCNLESSLSVGGGQDLSSYQNDSSLDSVPSNIIQFYYNGIISDSWMGNYPNSINELNNNIGLRYATAICTDTEYSGFTSSAQISYSKLIRTKMISESRWKGDNMTQWFDNLNDDQFYNSGTWKQWTASNDQSLKQAQLIYKNIKYPQLFLDDDFSELSKNYQKAILDACGKMPRYNNSDSNFYNKLPIAFCVNYNVSKDIDTGTPENGSGKYLFYRWTGDNYSFNENITK